MEADHLALALAVTVRHDGHGGVADDLAEPAGLTQWVGQHAEALREFGFTAGSASISANRPPSRAGSFAADAEALAAAIEVRTATRALFARAVSPGAPSKADAGRLPDAGTALARLNAAGARVPVAHRLEWPAGGAPIAGCAAAGEYAPADLLAAALARAAVAFLAGPDRVRLRACPAPRCVRYFIQAHARQEWCKPSCGNRARVARHHARRREEATAAQHAAAPHPATPRSAAPLSAAPHPAAPHLAGPAGPAR